MLAAILVILLLVVLVATESNTPQTNSREGNGRDSTPPIPARDSHHSEN